MDGHDKLMLIIVSVTIICITVLYSLLFLALWDYRQWVGLSLLAVIIFAVVIFLRGRMVEQELRLTRYRHAEETPLDQNGEPRFWHQGNLPNPHRH